MSNPHQIKNKIYRLEDYYNLFTKPENKEKYNQELCKIAEINYWEWYDSFYSGHLDVYPSSASLAALWHNAAVGQVHQVLDVLLTMNLVSSVCVP